MGIRKRERERKRKVNKRKIIKNQLKIIQTKENEQIFHL